MPPELLNAPEFPFGMENVWEAWCDLRDMRQSGMGIGPLTYSEIEAYIRLTAPGMETWEVLRPWEIRAIRVVDRTYRSMLSS